MTTLNSIYQKFKLNNKDVQRLQKECIQTAMDYGKRESMEEIDADDWDLLGDISDYHWYADIDLKNKIELGFLLFETFPSYYHFLIPFYRIFRDEKITNAALKGLIWGKFMGYLAAKNYLAAPVAYVLWVDFFEDETIAAETWKGLLAQPQSDQNLLKLIEVAGPIPFDLKEPIYHQLLPKKHSHMAIFNSILASELDVYGKINQQKAMSIISKLDIDREMDDYILLMERMK